MHLFCASSCPVAFRLSHNNPHDVTAGRNLIESICPKNNHYFLVVRAYKNDKTLALTKAHGFRTVISPKKNRKYDKQLHKQRNNIERYFLRLKHFRKVFTRYYKLDSIFISTVSLAFIFNLLFMRTLPN